LTDKQINWAIAILAVTAIIMLCVLSLAPDKAKSDMSFSGLSDEPEIIWQETSQEYGEYLYTVKVKSSCITKIVKAKSTLLLEDVCETSFYHFIGKSKSTQILVEISHYEPTARDMKLILGHYLIMVEDEGI